MKRRDWLLYGGVGAAAAVLGALSFPLLRQLHSGAARLQAAVLPDLSGRQRRLSEWRGQALLCNFWAPWCAPCRQEIPIFLELRRSLQAYGVEILGIGLDRADNVQKFAAELKIDYPLLLADMAAGLDLMHQLGNRQGALPFSVLLDRHGALAQAKLGELSRAEILSWAGVAG